MAADSARMTILHLLAGQGDRRAGRPYLPTRITDETGLPYAAVQQTLWALVVDKLVYLEPAGQTSWSNYEWRLTDLGHRAAEEGDYQPHDPDGFLARLRDRSHDLDELVLVYAREALAAYSSGCYLATAVMVGVASERALLLLMGSFNDEMLEGEERERFGAILGNERTRIAHTFSQFRKRLEVRKRDLPAELGENLTLHLDAVADLLRANRNDAGHPTGRIVTRDDAYVSLQLFARYVERLWALRRHWSGTDEAAAQH